MGVGVGVGPPTSVDFGEVPGYKRVFGEKIKYNRKESKMMTKNNKAYFVAVILIGGLFLGGCGVDKSGVEIVSNPMAKVYINGIEKGMTPYKDNSLKPGVIEIKLDNNNGNFWERKIKLENNVTSVINWTLGEEGDGGYILSMEKTGKKGGILVNSNPGGAMIYLDGELKNSTPALIEEVGGGDKKLSISFPGYKSVNLIIKVVDNYQLIVDTKLEKEDVLVPSQIPTKSLEPRLKILETETGWLRVRDAANNNGIEIGRAKPGEIYELLDENTDWYQIKFEEKSGWISTKYAEKIFE